ncbi:hypothetical protein LINGRAHAP2_LOCUS22353 [Linum grandiflorum]
MKRFRKCLGKIINASQNAFLDNRQIVNVAANELMDSRRASGKNCILLKHDLEKAFDSVSWDCMLFMLKRFNFPNTWISWIQSCISSVHYSVLVNGAPYGFFSSKRGFMMNEREGEGEVTHLLYADDALIFCEDSEEQVIFGVCILVITLEVGRLGKRSLVKIFSFGTLGLLIREEDPRAFHGHFTTTGSSLFTLSMSTSSLKVTKGNMIFQQIRFGLAAFHPKYVVLCG